MIFALIFKKFAIPIKKIVNGNWKKLHFYSFALIKIFTKYDWYDNFECTNKMLSAYRLDA